MTRSVFMRGTRPGERFSSPDGIGVAHYPAWLAAEIEKGRSFEVLKAIIQTEHVCTLDGTPVIFRAGSTYDVPKEVAQQLAAPIPGALPIAVIIEDPKLGPRMAKKESKEKEETR